MPAALVFLIAALGSAVSGTLGLCSLLKKDGTDLNRALGTALLTVSFSEAGHLLLLTGVAVLPVTGLALSLAAQALMPFAWHRVTSLQERRKRAYTRPQTGWYLFGAFLAAALVLFISREPVLSLPEQVQDGLPDAMFLAILGPFGKFFYSYLIIGLVLNLVKLESTLRALKWAGSEGSKKFIVYTGAILSAYLFYASSVMLAGGIEIRVLPVTSAVIALSGIMLSGTVLLRNLNDRELYVSRRLVFRSVAVLATGTYLILTGLIASWIEYFNIPFSYFASTLFSFIACVALILLLKSRNIKRYFEIYISTNFYRHKYEFRDKWKETVEKLGPVKSADEIIATLADLAGSTIGAKKICIWVRESSSGDYISVYGEACKTHLRLPAAHPVIRFFEKTVCPVYLNESVVSLTATREHDELRKLAALTETVLCVKIEAAGEMIGFMLAGPDVTGTPYTLDDLDLVKAISAQAAFQLKNRMLSEDLLAAKEAEAFHRMSSFVIHDLKNLASTLNLLNHNTSHLAEPDFQKDAAKTISLTAGRLKDLISRLSEPAHEVYAIRPSNLNEVFDTAIMRVNPKILSKMRLVNESSALPALFADAEALANVLHNLIVNAAEAGATEVRINTFVTPEHAGVIIADNGTGIEPGFLRKSLFKPFKTTKRSGLGIGLYQCRSIMEAHGGSIQAQSEPGSGTTFTLRLPLASSLAVN